MNTVKEDAISGKKRKFPGDDDTDECAFEESNEKVGVSAQIDLAAPTHKTEACDDLEPELDLLQIPSTGIQFMDLPDETLLHIVEFCKPREIKALGFACQRLQEVCRSKSALWTRVDLTADKCGRRRLATYLGGNYLNKSTLSLAVRGYSEATKGCQGRKRNPNQPIDPNSNFYNLDIGTFADDTHSLEGNDWEVRHTDTATVIYTTIPSRSGSEPPPKLARLRGSPVLRGKEIGCSGPRWTLHTQLLKTLKSQCPQLTELRIEYCNLDCDQVRITDFPKTLKKLSLKGTRCYDTPLSQTYLFMIHDTLVDLESFDVSYCSWLSASYLLSLSKMPKLKELKARGCYRLGECVAYSSLATRYGFKTLEVLDIRETPMSDSEVAALGWLPRLRELYLQAPPKKLEVHSEKISPEAAFFDLPKHMHSFDEELNDGSDIEDWELPDLKMASGEEDWMNKKRTSSSTQTPTSSTAQMPLTRTRIQISGPWLARRHANGHLEAVPHPPPPAAAPDPQGANVGERPQEDEYNRDAERARIGERPSIAELLSAATRPRVNNRAENDRPDPILPPDRPPAFPFGNVQVVACMAPATVGAIGVGLTQEPTDPQSLVSDFGLLRLGRISSSEYLRVGPHGMILIPDHHNQQNNTPNKSPLQKLVCVGYTRVTDRSITQLATSMPNLTYVDVTGTAVTKTGAAALPHATVIM